MGWTSKIYTAVDHNEFAKNNICISDFIEHEISSHKYLVLKAAMFSDSEQHELYLKMQNDETKEKFVLVVLICIREGEIYWKEIEESMGPSYYKCPIDWFEDYEPKGEYSTNWRKECLRSHGVRA